MISLVDFNDKIGIIY